MKKDYLKDEANALRVQKHQLNNTEDKLSEIDRILSGMQKDQNSNNDVLDNMLNDMDALLKSNSTIVSDETVAENMTSIENELNINYENKSDSLVSEIENIKIDDNASWNEYVDLVEGYGFKNNLNLKEDPFKHLMTKSQQVELQKRINDDFTLKNADCDKYDYMIAGTCGVIGGLIDVLFVGMPGDSKLGNIADEQANKITEKFAEFVGWDKGKAVEKGKNTTASAIGYLEGKFKINYDQATTHATDGAVKNLSLKNHHLKSLGHSPDLIGLFFSILNQFKSTSTFVSNGQIITIDTETFQLKGNDFISKVFSGFANWFGHIMSDWSGSSGTVGQGGRGTGVPIPFYNLFQMMNFGEFGQHKQTFATVTTKVFENGYDARHAMAMAIPVVTTELLVRFMFTMKSHYYHKREWKDSIPNGNIPELRRMLLVGHGTLCLIDGVDAYIRSGGEMVTFLSRTNLLAWARFGQLSLKELNAWYNSGHIDADAVDEYLDQEYRKMLTNKSSGRKKTRR
jgi:hypothetical protein